jgi:hypothetical protein
VRCPCCDYDLGSKTKPRSIPQLRRFFGLIRALAKRYWPEDHPRQFDGDEIALRKYLQLRAGPEWREVGSSVNLVDLNCPNEIAVTIARAAIEAGGTYCEPVVHNGSLVTLRAKSISIPKMDHDPFTRLANAVDEVIEAETGLKPEAVLEAWRMET